MANQFGSDNNNASDWFATKWPQEGLLVLNAKSWILQGTKDCHVFISGKSSISRPKYRQYRKLIIRILSQIETSGYGLLSLLFLTLNPVGHQSTN